MAWVIESWDFQVIGNASTSLDITVHWQQDNDASSGEKKRGCFNYTIVTTNTWTETKAAIETLIAADDGMDC